MELLDPHSGAYDRGAARHREHETPAHHAEKLDRTAIEKKLELLTTVIKEKALTAPEILQTQEDIELDTDRNLERMIKERAEQTVAAEMTVTAMSYSADRAGVMLESAKKVQPFAPPRPTIVPPPLYACKQNREPIPKRGEPERDKEDDPDMDIG